MRHADLRSRDRRIVAGVLVVTALLTGPVTQASAAPTSEERRQVAEQVADATCHNVPVIQKLPRSVDPHELCTKVIVENIDPEGSNSGVRAACEAALPIVARPAAKYCVVAIDKLLDPARKVFLDRVVPAVQQLGCVSTAPAAFDCLSQQVHVWLKQSIMSLWQGLITVLTSDTKVTDLVQGWRNRGIVSLYQDVGSLSATVVLALVFVALIVSVILFDFRRLGGVLIGLIGWGVFVVSGATIAVLLVRASDAAAIWLAGRPGPDGQTDLARAGREFATWVDYVTSTTRVTGVVHPVYNPGSLTAILICLLLALAIIVTLFALLMRTIALLLLIITLPLTLAGAAGPRVTQQWMSIALRLFVAMLFAKPLIVIAVRLGAVLVSVPRAGEAQASFSDALLGVALILIAGLLPGVIYRYSGGLMQTSAGAAPRAAGGWSEQAGQSTQTTLDMTRMIMERNAPRPLSPVPSTGGAGPRPATSTSPAAGSSGLAGLAGPLGLAAAGLALAGGAAESGARWVGGQAATAGGVFGDVEAPKVPSAPISRLGHLPAGAPPSSSSRPPGVQDTSAGERPTPVQIILTPTPTPTPPSPPAVPGRPSPLVLPGSVVPDEPAGPPELPAAPKALPGREDMP
jgi:hypothetical protein